MSEFGSIQHRLFSSLVYTRGFFPPVGKFWVWVASRGWKHPWKVECWNGEKNRGGGRRSVGTRWMYLNAASQNGRQFVSVVADVSAQKLMDSLRHIEKGWEVACLSFYSLNWRALEREKSFAESRVRVSRHQRAQVSFTLAFVSCREMTFCITEKSPGD